MSATVTHLPMHPGLPDLVLANWDDPIVRQIWDELTCRQDIRLNLVRTWLEIRDPDELVGAANKLPPVRYWAQRCMDALSSRHPLRRFPAA